MIRTVINILLIVLIAVAGVFGINSIKASRVTLETREGGSAEVVKLEAARVSRVGIDDHMMVKGATEPLRTWKLGAEVAGSASIVNAAEMGSRIKAGDVLVKLDSELLELDREKLLNSRATIELGIKAAEADVERVKNSLRIAEENYEIANEMHKRNVELYQSGSLALNLLDASRLELLRAEQAVVTAKDGLVLSQLSVERTRSELVGIDTSVKKLEETIERCVVRAPSDALLVRRDCEVGEYITPGKVLFVLQRCDILYFRAQVPAEYFHRLVPGAKAVVTLFDLQGREFEATVEEFGVEADAATRSYPVRMLLANEDLAIRPGLFGVAEVALPQRVFAISIPTRALLNDGGKKFVYLVGAETAELRYITVGRTRLGHAEVLDGLQNGDLVAVSAFDKLTPGMPIEVYEIINGTPATDGAEARQ